MSNGLNGKVQVLANALADVIEAASDISAEKAEKRFNAKLVEMRRYNDDTIRTVRDLLSNRQEVSHAQARKTSAA